MASGISVVLLIGLLLAAAWSDIRRLQIPNTIVFSGILSALALALYAGGVLALGRSLAGALLGMSCLLPFFALRMMGAGDVKLMAMVGAFLGPVAAVGATLATMLAGGVVSVFCWLRARQRAATAEEVVDLKAMRVPYGVAILLGTLGWLLASRYPGLAGTSG